MQRVGWFALGMSILAAATCSAAPRLSLAEVRYNFGLAVEGDIVSHTFVIGNTGDEPLSVLDVVTECGCTAGEVTVNPLEPGALGELVVVFHTEGYGGASVSKVVSLVTDDPGLPVATFELAGWVMRREAVLLDPASAADSVLLMIDLRDWSSYASGHLLGAVHLEAADAPAWLEQLPSDAAILLYDQDGVESTRLAVHLVATGHAGVRSLAGGLDAWLREFGDRWVLTVLPLIVAPGAAP